MRKLIMWNVVTLDGYFQGQQDWDLSFHNSVWGEELERLSLEQLHAADYLIFGRVTYEGMAAYWTQETGAIANLMNTIPKIVVSRTLTSATWNNSILIRDEVSEHLTQLKREGGKDMYVFGSAHLSETLMRDELFDEYRIGIAPVVLGSGRQLFKPGVTADLQLLSAQSLQTGGVVLKYAKAGAEVDQRGLGSIA